jgi:hypothetical protein
VQKGNSPQLFVRRSEGHRVKRAGSLSCVALCTWPAASAREASTRYASSGFARGAVLALPFEPSADLAGGPCFASAFLIGCFVTGAGSMQRRPSCSISARISAACCSRFASSDRSASIAGRNDVDWVRVVHVPNHGIGSSAVASINSWISSWVNGSPSARAAATRSIAGQLSSTTPLWQLPRRSPWIVMSGCRFDRKKVAPCLFRPPKKAEFTRSPPVRYPRTPANGGSKWQIVLPKGRRVTLASNRDVGFGYIVYGAVLHKQQRQVPGAAFFRRGGEMIWTSSRAAASSGCFPAAMMQ